MAKCKAITGLAVKGLTECPITPAVVLYTDSRFICISTVQMCSSEINYTDARVNPSDMRCKRRETVGPDIRIKGI